MTRRSKLFRWVYIIVAVVLLGSFFTGGATGFRLLSVGATVSAAVAGPTLIRHK